MFLMMFPEWWNLGMHKRVPTVSEKVIAAHDLDVNLQA